MNFRSVTESESESVSAQIGANDARSISTAFRYVGLLCMYS